MSEDNKREGPRISWNFIIRHKPSQNGEITTWDVCFIKNISLKGCYCSSDRPYKEDRILDIQIQLPFFKEPLQLSGKVKRCDTIVDSIYGIAIEFLDLDENQQNILRETVAVFLQKQVKGEDKPR